MKFKMHLTPQLKISILFYVFASVLSAPGFSQTKTVREIDVTKCWAYPLSEGSGMRLISGNGRLFLGLSGSKVEALSLDGTKMWASDLGGEITSNVLAVDNGLFLVTSSVSTETTKSGTVLLRHLSQETGVTNWTLKLPESERTFLSIFNGNVIVVSTSGVIHSIDAKTGFIRWRREIAEGFTAEPVFGVTNIIVGATSGQIFGVSLGSGEIDWMRKSVFSVTTLGEMATGELVAGDERGNVASFPTGTEKPKWRFKTGGQISRVLRVGENIVATSHDNFVYSLTGGNGNVVWKRRLEGRVSHIGRVLDEFLIISSFEENGGVLTDWSNGRIAGRISLANDENMVSDPISANGLIFIVSNQAVYGFSLSGCHPNGGGRPGR